MELLEKMVDFVNIEVEEPIAFGPLHLLFIFLVVALSVFLCIKFKDSYDRTFRLIIGGAFVIMLILEVIKQVLFRMSVVDGEIVYEYAWSDFPFQLCSTPLYVLPFLAILPDGRLRDLAASYTMTFALIGGISVYTIPQTVFSCNGATNIQTMIHHGLQIVTGVLTAVYYRRRINTRFFIGGVSVFALMIAIACILNTVGYDTFVSLGWMAEGDSFNMFYISPRADQSVPVLSELLKSFPPAVYIVGYFVALTLIAALLTYLFGTLYKLSRKV